MQIEVKTILPELAEQWLKCNTHNRRVRQSVVDKYAKDMERGAWQLHHQGIAFNGDGTLVDGQHRLMAIVQSGVPVEMMVTWGVASGNQLTIDDHSKRDYHDALSLSGDRTVGKAHVAIVRAMCQSQEGALQQRMTKSQMASQWHLFADACEFAAESAQPPVRGLSNSSLWAAVMAAWYYESDLDRLRRFGEVVRKPDIENGIPGHDMAAMCVREYFLTNKIVGGYSIRKVATMKTQRAVFAFMRYEPLSKLYASRWIYKWPLEDSAIRGQK